MMMREKAWGLAARNAIVADKRVDPAIADDVTIIGLCRALNKLPAEIMSMSPDWFWKFPIVFAAQEERAERDSKK